VSGGDFSAIPDDSTYVFHAAVDTGAAEWRPCVRTNAHNSGNLLYHCRRAKGFVYCSTGSIYKYQGHPLKKADAPGAAGKLQFSKVAHRCHPLVELQLRYTIGCTAQKRCMHAREGRSENTTTINTDQLQARSP
jgi:nucleoside-diphosphate-sugar epimerase